MCISKWDVLRGVIRGVCIHRKENKWIILKAIFNIEEQMYLEGDWNCKAIYGGLIYHKPLSNTENSYSRIANSLNSYGRFTDWKINAFKRYCSKSFFGIPENGTESPPPAWISTRHSTIFRNGFLWEFLHGRDFHSVPSYFVLPAFWELCWSIEN